MLTEDEILKYQVIQPINGPDWTTLTPNGKFQREGQIIVHNYNGNYVAYHWDGRGWILLNRKLHPAIVMAAFPHNIVCIREEGAQQINAQRV